MSDLTKYMNAPDIVGEPSALREIHAIRLKIHEETKGLSPEERVALANKKARKIMDKYHLSHLRASSQELDIVP